MVSVANSFSMEEGQAQLCVVLAYIRTCVAGDSQLNDGGDGRNDVDIVDYMYLCIKFQHSYACKHMLAALTYSHTCNVHPG